MGDVCFLSKISMKTIGDSSKGAKSRFFSAYIAKRDESEEEVYVVNIHNDDEEMNVTVEVRRSAVIGCLQNDGSCIRQ